MKLLHDCSDIKSLQLSITLMLVTIREMAQKYSESEDSKVMVLTFVVMLLLWLLDAIYNVVVYTISRL